MAKTFNCPNCAAPLSATIHTTKLIDCAHCDSTVLLHDQGAQTAGLRGQVRMQPSLLNIGQTFSCNAQQLTPVGFARFDYGRGFWDEFWCQDQHAQGYWASVDEGDYYLEQPLEQDIADIAPKLGAQLTYNQQTYRALESNRAKITALRGELPELLQVGDQFQFVDFFAANGAMLTLEIDQHGRYWHAGHWLDPYQIRSQ